MVKRKRTDVQGKFVRPRRGRPQILTPELIAKIQEALEIGMYVETACAINDISKQTFYAWLREGATAKSGLKKDFSDAVRRGSARGEARDVMAISKAVQDGQAKFACWRLERKFPERWGRRDTVAVQHGGEVAVRVQQRREALMQVAKDPEMRAALIKMSHALRPARTGSGEIVDGQIIEGGDDEHRSNETD